MFSSKCETFSLQVHHTEFCCTFFSCLRWNLVLFCHCTVVHFDLISNTFLCRYASRTLRMKLLTWCRVMSGRAFRVGPGSGLSLSKYFGPISGLHTKLFYNIKSNDFFDFFVSWRRFVVLTAVTSVSEVILMFLQLILFANTAAFFYSLLGWVSHCFWEGESGEEISARWRCVEKIDHSHGSWLVLRSLQAGFSYLYSCPRKFLLCL